MQLWALLGGLTALNIAAAFAATVVVIPVLSANMNALAGTRNAFPQAVALVVPDTVRSFLVPVPRQPQLDSRIRTIVRREIGEDDQAIEGATVPQGQAPAAALLAAQPSPDAAMARPQGDNAARTSQPGSRFNSVRFPDPTRVYGPANQPVTVAWMTPFGMYQPGIGGAGMVMLSLVTLLALSALTALLIPDRLQTVRTAMQLSWRRSLILAAIGVIGLGLSAALITVLWTLVVNVVFAPVVMAVVAAAVLLGFSAVVLALGHGLRSRAGVAQANPLADLAIGVLAVFPLSLVPVAGWVIIGALSVFGVGAVVATKFGGPHGWSLAPLAEMD